MTHIKSIYIPEWPKLQEKQKMGIVSARTNK